MSNVNINSFAITGNAGQQGNYLEPSLIVMAVAVPLGTSIPGSAMVSSAAFVAYVNTVGGTQGFGAETRSKRWFKFGLLDQFEDKTKQPSVDDTGKNQQNVINYNPTYAFRMLVGRGNFLDYKTFNNTKAYSWYFIDDNGTWMGQTDPTGAGGLYPYTSLQLWVGNSMFLTDKKLNIYPLQIALDGDKQINDLYAYFACPLLTTSELGGLVNLVLTDVSSILSGIVPSYDSTTDITVIGKSQNGSVDWIATYASELTAGCFRAYNLSTSTAATVASITKGTAIVSNQTYSWVNIRLSAAPTATNKVQVSIVGVSELEAIVTDTNVVIDYFPGTQSVGSPIHTFS